MSFSRGSLLCAVCLAVSACSNAPSPHKAPGSHTPDASAKSEAKRKSLAQLEALVGTVTLEREGVTRAAAAEKLYAGDAIETGAQSAAVVHFSEGRIVELSADGRFELALDGSGAMLTVAQGLVLTRIKAPLANEEGDDDVLLSISTPFGLTRIGSAELSMKVDDGSVALEVSAGEIELVSKSGEVTKVGTGLKMRLGTVRELPIITLNIVASSGKGEFKAKEAKAFVPINFKKLSSLQEGDVVRVKDGTINLAPGSSATRLSLLKGTEVGVGESRKGEGKESTTLDVRKGELEVWAPAAQATRVLLTQGLTLISDQGGQYALRKTPTGFDLDAYAGDVRVERANDDSIVVPGGQAASIPLSGIAAVRPANPESLALPSRLGMRIFHGASKQLSLTWDDDGLQPGGWRVQLASDPNFRTVVRDGLVHVPFLSVPVPPKGSWYWRVWKGEREHAKGSATFAKEPRTADLSRLKNVVVDGADTTTIFYQDKDKPPMVTFNWNKSEGATKYAVKVYREGQLATSVAERVVPETQVSLPENSLTEGNYLWSLTPVDASGNELSGGKLNRLHLVFDNAVASLTINRPREGELAGKLVTAAGVAPVGSRLFINGKSVPLDEQARFETQVSPLPGGRIVFRLLHEGTEIYTVRTVRNR